MRIIGFNFKKIQAERKKELKKDLKVNTNLEIDSIEKDKIDIAGEILKFNYTYRIDYEPDLAEILFKGEIVVIPDDSKKIMKDWKKKKIEDKVRIPIFNFAISKCNLKALQIEEDFTLPSHIPLPRIMPQQNKQQSSKPGPANYTG